MIFLFRFVRFSFMLDIGEYEILFFFYSDSFFLIEDWILKMRKFCINILILIIGRYD